MPVTGKKTTMYSVRLIPQDEMGVIIPYLRMLDSNIPEAVLQQRLEAMMQHNYLCAGVYDGDTLIGISGMWVLEKYYVGKHIEPDNVIIHPDYRGVGAGELLIQWIHDYAKEQGCLAMELNCYVSNHKGVVFWIKQGYRILGYHFRKDL